MQNLTLCNKDVFYAKKQRSEGGLSLDVDQRAKILVGGLDDLGRQVELCLVHQRIGGFGGKIGGAGGIHL